MQRVSTLNGNHSLTFHNHHKCAIRFFYFSKFVSIDFLPAAIRWA